MAINQSVCLSMLSGWTVQIKYLIPCEVNNLVYYSLDEIKRLRIRSKALVCFVSPEIIIRIGFFFCGVEYDIYSMIIYIWKKKQRKTWRNVMAVVTPHSSNGNCKNNHFFGGYLILPFFRVFLWFFFKWWFVPLNIILLLYVSSVDPEMCSSYSYILVKSLLIHI